MLEREGSVLRLRIAEVTVLAQVQFAGCLLCLLGRNQGCCVCSAGIRAVAAAGPVRL